MNALALDLGASGGKFLLGTLDGDKIRSREIHRFDNQPLEVEGHLHWDVPRIRANLVAGITRAAGEGFSSFGVDSFCNDYGLLGADGEMVGPVYTYRDRRTVGVLQWMDELMAPKELYRRTGNQRARFNTLVQLAAQTRSADRALLDRATRLLFLPDLLDYFLCGAQAAEYTIASVSQLYNRAERRWDPEFLSAFGIPHELFPEVMPTGSMLGTARQELLDQTGGRPFSICAVPHHDTAAAVAAVPAGGEHFAYISSGTWSLVGTETDSMITSEGAFNGNFANEGGSGGRNRFIKNTMGLWLVQECRREFNAMGMRQTFAELDAAAEEASAFRSIVDPDDPSFFEPGDMPGKIQARCRLWGQPVPETPGQMIRCIQESLALSYRATLQELEDLTGYGIAAVHVVGGGARSGLLNQFAASAMKRPVYAGPYEVAAVGNLCSQFISAGELDGWADARRLVASSFEIREYLPKPDSAWEDA